MYPLHEGRTLIASVIIDEDLFQALLADRSAAQGVSFFVRMGETRLVEGLGEIYENPVVMAVQPEGEEQPPCAGCEDNDCEEHMICPCEDNECYS